MHQAHELVREPIARPLVGLLTALRFNQQVPQSEGLAR